MTKTRLQTQQSRESSRKEIFQQADKGNELSVSKNFIGSDEKVNSQQKEILNEKDHPINQNANNLEYDKKQSSKTNNKDSLQPINKENDPDKKDNSINPQQKVITCSDDTITSSDATIIIQKSKSSKTKADEAVVDKTESNTSF